MGEMFWNVAPYVTLAIVAVGSWWRYRYDKFGRRSCTSRDCCGSPARCSTSAFWWWSPDTSSVW